MFSGTTNKTTAKITANQGNNYYELYKRYGKRVSEQYYNAQIDGMRGYADLIERYNIDCDFMRTDGNIFSCTSGKELSKTCEILQSFGAECELVENVSPVDAVCTLKMSNQFLFDSVKFLCALPVNFEIYEKTRVVDIDAKNKILYCGSKIQANKIIIATHFPIIDGYGGYIFKLWQSLSYTIATKEKITDKMFLDEKADGLSVRPYVDGTIFGCFDHRTGRLKNTDCFERLRTIASDYGAVTVTNGWTAEDVMTFDGMPFAGGYSDKLEGVYVVTGFNKWGMTNSMVCAEIIRDEILSKENKYAQLFLPQRKINGSIKDLASNIFTNIKCIAGAYLPLQQNR